MLTARPQRESKESPTWPIKLKLAAIPSTEAVKTILYDTNLQLSWLRKNFIYYQDSTRINYLTEEKSEITNPEIMKSVDDWLKKIIHYIEKLTTQTDVSVSFDEPIYKKHMRCMLDHEWENLKKKYTQYLYDIYLYIRQRLEEDMTPFTTPKSLEKILIRFIQKNQFSEKIDETITNITTICQEIDAFNYLEKMSQAREADHLFYIRNRKLAVLESTKEDENPPHSTLLKEIFIHYEDRINAEYATISTYIQLTKQRDQIRHILVSDLHGSLKDASGKPVTLSSSDHAFYNEEAYKVSIELARLTDKLNIFIKDTSQIDLLTYVIEYLLKVHDEYLKITACLEDKPQALHFKGENHHRAVTTDRHSLSKKDIVKSKANLSKENIEQYFSILLHEFKLNNKIDNVFDVVFTKNNEQRIVLSKKLSKKQPLLPQPQTELINLSALASTLTKKHTSIPISHYFTKYTSARCRNENIKRLVLDDLLENNQLTEDEKKAYTDFLKLKEKQKREPAQFKAEDKASLNALTAEATDIFNSKCTRLSENSRITLSTNSIFYQKQLLAARSTLEPPPPSGDECREVNEVMTALDPTLKTIFNHNK